MTEKYKKELEQKAEDFLNRDNEQLDELIEENLKDLKLTSKQAGVILGIIKGAYITGAIENGFELHDLTEDPNDLPKEFENVLCYVHQLGVKYYCVGHIIIGGDNVARWWANNKCEQLKKVLKWYKLPK